MLVTSTTTACKAVRVARAPVEQAAPALAVRFVQRRFNLSPSLAATIASLAMLGGRP